MGGRADAVDVCVVTDTAVVASEGRLRFISLGTGELLGERLANEGETVLCLAVGEGICAAGTAEGCVVIFTGQIGVDCVESARVKHSDLPICSIALHRTPLGAVNIIAGDHSGRVGCYEPWCTAASWKVNVPLEGTAYTSPVHICGNVLAVFIAVVTPAGRVHVLRSSGTAHCTLLAEGAESCDGVTHAPGCGSAACDVIFIATRTELCAFALNLGPNNTPVMAVAGTVSIDMPTFVLRSSSEPNTRFEAQVAVCSGSSLSVYDACRTSDADGGVSLRRSYKATARSALADVCFLVGGEILLCEESGRLARASGLR